MTARASLAVAMPETERASARELRRAEPFTLIIFGAGDLLHRKLMPSLFHLLGDGLILVNCLSYSFYLVAARPLLEQLPRLAIIIITAISTIFLYAAYGLVIFLGATTTGWIEHRVWSLRRWSKQ